MRISRSWFLIGLGAAFALLAAGPARAQTMGGNPNTSRAFQQMPSSKHSQGTQSESLPPALPGATASYAPAEKTNAELSPNDALFDAVNRGDIGSARDAIKHGADLGAQNILGMTPLELSVDLGRNDITFLLLSLRGSSTPARPAPGASVAAKADTKLQAAKTAAAKPVPKLTAAAPRPTAVATAQATAAPQQFAGPGSTGTPDPQAGFLGFGGPAQ
jgi:ankyrin repeat protein